MKARELIAKLKENPEFAQAYAELEPQHQIAREVIRLRVQRGLTQQELAQKVGTQQANISRLENAVGSPSVSLLLRVARALDARLSLELVAREQDGRRSAVAAYKARPAVADPNAVSLRYTSQAEWHSLQETSDAHADE